MAKRFDVFISYSREDSAVADEICESFDRHGIKYFIDRSEIGVGDDYINRLFTAINDSQMMLYLASQYSYESYWTNKEIAYAIRKKRNRDILPYVIDDAPMPEDKEFLLADINICKMSEYSIEDIIQRIKSRIPELEEYDIFISGSRRLANEIEQAHDTLAKQGYRCFSWKNLQKDIDEESQVARAVATCKLFVYFIRNAQPVPTQAYYHSWTAKELKSAFMWQKKIVIVNVADPSGLPDNIRNLVFLYKNYEVTCAASADELPSLCPKLIGQGTAAERQPEESAGSREPEGTPLGFLQKARRFFETLFAAKNQK